MIWMRYTFDGDFLFASSRMREEIHLNTDFSNWAFLCASSIWNFIKNKLDFIYKFKLFVTTREKTRASLRLYSRLKFWNWMLKYYIMYE